MEKHFCPYCMTPVKEGEPCEACGLTAGTYSPSPHHLPPGTILMDRYLVGRVLGEGGFGITYIGCDLRLELKVAIKEYFPSDKVTRHAQASLEVSNYTGALAGNYERGKEKYLQEARTMARMNKQAEIVSVRDFFETNNTAYIVMEYVEGTTFKELVAQRGGRIPAGEFLHMIEPLFFALEEMHETGLIHRDISPDNLMLEGGNVRLLDFGCARESTHGTETMTIALKHGYAPIEQYQHKGQGPWTDVYALCATMYYCLTGKVPQQSLDRLCEDELILPRKLGVEMTENQERALLYGMGIRPRRRYQSVQELYAALYTGVPAPEIEIGQGSLFAPETPTQGAAAPASGGVSEGQSKTEEAAAPAPEAPEKDAAEKSETAGKAGKEASDTGDAEEKRKKTIRQVKIGAAAAAIVCLVAIPFLLRGKLHPDSSETAETASTQGIANTPTQPGAEPEEDPFAEAIPVTAGGAAALRAALEGDAAAVIWDIGENIQLTEPLTLTKPLYIGKGSYLELDAELTVADGGRIQLAGSLNNRGFLQAEGNGKIVVEDGATLEGQGSIFVAAEENFMVGDGSTVNIFGVDFSENGFDRNYFVDFSEERIFAEAAHVHTGKELMDALNNYNVQSVVIDGDIELSNAFRYMDKSVMVSEGVTVTAPGDLDASLCFDGWFFVNYGTISGDFQIGDWNEDGRTSNVFNYGEIGNDVYVESQCNIVNKGRMQIGVGQIKDGKFYNLGELVHDDSKGDERFLDIMGNQFTNLGRICLERSGSSGDYVRMTLCSGAGLLNQGSIEVGAASQLDNWGKIDGYGQIVVTDTLPDFSSGVYNKGIIRLEYSPSADKAASLQIPGYGEFDNEGMVAFSSHSTINLPRSLKSCNGAAVPFAWGDGDENWRFASTAQELKEALNDDACSTVILDTEGDDITLEEELVVTKGLAMAWPGNLCFTNGGLTLKGENAYLWDGRLEMNGNEITVSDGAVLATDKIRQAGGLRIDREGKVILQNYEEDAFLPNTSIVLENGGRMLEAGYNELKSQTVSIGAGSVFSIISEYNIENTDISVENNGEFWIQTRYGRIDENSMITNNGRLEIGSWDECLLHGEIVNNNHAEWYVRLNLEGGKLTNNGDMRIDVGDGSFFYGNGVVENNGRIESPCDRQRLIEEFEGDYIGAEVQPEN